MVKLEVLTTLKPKKEVSLLQISLKLPAYSVATLFTEMIIAITFSNNKSFGSAVPWLRQLFAGLPLRRPVFDPGLVHVGFVVDKVALGQVFPL
jgi:hypothetical protein